MERRLSSPENDTLLGLQPENNDQEVAGLSRVVRTNEELLIEILIFCSVEQVEN